MQFQFNSDPFYCLLISSYNYSLFHFRNEISRNTNPSMFDSGGKLVFLALILLTNSYGKGKQLEKVFVRSFWGGAIPRICINIIDYLKPRRLIEM